MTKDTTKDNKKIAGIDFGSKRIGVAVSDDLGMLAFPLTTVSGFGHNEEKREERVNKTEQEIIAILKEKEIKVVIIGHSVDLKGIDNSIMTDARALGGKLESEGFTIFYEPELYSTVQATKLQGENKDVDASAAAIILQSYLDRIKFKNMNTQTQDEPREELKHITIDDFIKVEMRIGQILSAEKIEGSDKLLKLSVDFGEDQPRQVLSGIAKMVEIEEIVGKKFPFVTNLAPRMMMGMESQAMILAGSAGETLALLNPSKDLPNGTKLK